MKLKEYEGKRLFEEFGIKIPKGYLVDSVSKLGKPKKGSFILKAQTLSGKRGKAGAIIKAKHSVLRKECKKLLGKKINGEAVKEILVEEVLPVKKELYLSLSIDRNSRNIALLFSTRGGMDIEEIAEKYPKDVKKLNFSEFNQNQIKKIVKNKKLFEVVKSLYELMKDRDCLLVEVNPLVLTKKGDYYAADSKVIIDDNSLFKHLEFNRKKNLNRLEKIAVKKGVNFVQMQGDIAVIGNGAGLVMATLDILKKNKLLAADFLDVGGGAERNKVKASLEIVNQTNPKLIFLNIFGGITDCMEIFEGFDEFIDENNLSIPVVARIIGNNSNKAIRLFKEQNVFAHNDPKKCLKEIKRLLE